MENRSKGYFADVEECFDRMVASHQGVVAKIVDITEVVVKDKTIVVVTVGKEGWSSIQKDIHSIILELERTFPGKNFLAKSGNRPESGKEEEKGKKISGPVRDKILEDIVRPCKIVGKRIRYKVDGSKLVKIFLDSSNRKDYETKLEVFSAACAGIMNQKTVFEFSPEVVHTAYMKGIENQ